MIHRSVFALLEWNAKMSGCLPEIWKTAAHLLGLKFLKIQVYFSNF